MVINGVFKAKLNKNTGGVPAVVIPFRVAQTALMGIRYSDHAKEPPGCNIYKLRQALGLSQRAVADKCRPALDHTTIRRLENNQGYTQDTLERVARVFNVTIQELFLPPELAEWPTLPEEARERIAASIADSAIATKYRSHG